MYPFHSPMAALSASRTGPGLESNSAVVAAKKHPPANTRSLLGGSNLPYVFARRALVARLRAAGADDALVARLAEVDDLTA